MIQKVVKKRALNDDSTESELCYWLGRPETERVETVDLLRKEQYGSADRLQRVVKIIKQPRG
jgi:hypothetical protein